MELQFSSAKLALESNPFASLKATHDQWAKIRGQRFAPARADFDPADLPRHLLPRIAMIDVRRDPLDFTYRLCGTAVAELHCMDLTGRSVADLMPDGFATEMWQQYEEIVERKAPGLYLHQLQGKAGSLYPLATLGLPFSSDGATVDLVLSIDEYGAAMDQLRTFFRITAQAIQAPAAL